MCSHVLIGRHVGAAAVPDVTPEDQAVARLGHDNLRLVLAPAKLPGVRTPPAPEGLRDDKRRREVGGNANEVVQRGDDVNWGVVPRLKHKQPLRRNPCQMSLLVVGRGACVLTSALISSGSSTFCCKIILLLVNQSSYLAKTHDFQYTNSRISRRRGSRHARRGPGGSASPSG